MFPCEDSKTLSVCPYPEKRNHLSFVNISPTLVIDTSMERSSRVLHHGNPRFWFFFQNRSKLNFDLCRRVEIVLVGLNKHLYDDIGDASSSLRGSTSSSACFSFNFILFCHQLSHYVCQCVIPLKFPANYFSCLQSCIIYILMLQ